MDYEGFFSDISTVPAPEASKGTLMRRDTSTRNSRSSQRGRNEHERWYLTRGINPMRHGNSSGFSAVPQ
jgi:hypothetical protein